MRRVVQRRKPMKRIIVTAIVAGITAVSSAAAASGNPAAGEKTFNKCKACHAIVDADGATIVKGGKTGPNLWGLPGRTAGTEPNFKRYKKALVAAGEAGLVWNEADFLAYAQDPTEFLRERLGDKKARSGMTFKLRDEGDAADIWSFISSVSPEPGS